MRTRLVAILRSVSPRVYLHGAAPIGVIRPYVTYFTFAAKPVKYIDKAAPDSKHAAAQISVWSGNQLEADELMQQIEEAIRTASSINGEPQTGAIDAPYEPDTKLCGSIQRFDIWATR